MVLKSQCCFLSIASVSASCAALFGCLPRQAAQEVLPFAPVPSASKPGLTIQDSTYKKRVEPRRLAEVRPTSSSS